VTNGRPLLRLVRVGRHFKFMQDEYEHLEAPLTGLGDAKK